MGPQPGDLLRLIVGGEDVLVARLAVAKTTIAHAVAVVLAVPAVLALHAVVEIARGIGTASIAAIVAPPSQRAAHQEASPVRRLDTLVVARAGAGRGVAVVADAEIEVTNSLSAAISWAAGVVEDPRVSEVGWH